MKASLLQLRGALRPWLPPTLTQRVALYGALWALLSVNGATLSLRPQQAWYGAGLLAVALWLGVHMVERRGLPRSPITVPLAGCLVVAACSALVSPNRQLATQGLLTWCALAALALALASLLLRGLRPALVFEALLGVSGLYLLGGLRDLWLAYSAWWAARVPGLPLVPDPVRVATFVYPTQFAGLIALLLPLALALLWGATSRVARAALVCWLLAALVVLWGTASRGGWLASGVAGGVAVAGLLWSDGRALPLAGLLRARWRTLALLAAVAALFGALVLLTGRSVGQSRGGIGGLTGRDVFWAEAWRLFQARPLLGWGLDTYPWRFVYDQPFARSYIPPHAHNLLLQLLAELGAAGALAFAALVGSGVWAVARETRDARRETRDATTDGEVSGVRREAQSAATDSESVALTPQHSALSTQHPAIVLAASWCGMLAYYAFDMTGFELAVVAVALTVACLGAMGLLRWPASPLPRPVGALALALLLVAGALLYPLLSARAALMAAREASWRPEGAGAELAALLRRDPQVARLYPELVAFVLSADAPNGAVAQIAHGAYADALASEPGNAVVRVYAAALRLETAPREAVAPLEEATRFDPGWPLPPLLLGRAYERLGDGRAAARYADAIRLDPAYANTLACATSPICHPLAQPAPNAVAAGASAVEALVGNRDSGAWQRLAEGFAAEGRDAEARYALDTAGRFDLDGSPGLRERYALLWAALRERAGDAPAALVALADRPAATCCYPSSTGAVVGPFGLRPSPALADLLQTPLRARLLHERARLLRAAGDDGAASAADEEASALEYRFSQR